MVNLNAFDHLWPFWAQESMIFLNVPILYQKEQCNLADMVLATNQLLGWPKPWMGNAKVKIRSFSSPLMLLHISKASIIHIWNINTVPIYDRLKGIKPTLTSATHQNKYLTDNESAKQSTLQNIVIYLRMMHFDWEKYCWHRFIASLL